ncbi:class I SAM-dependent methyltransferase (plasmid) [Rhodococcus pseudokoreensis]|uniref:Class I SAM-dependent methyltransferase n=1 Tax=Rhodococcus pseudokoreensis TaxID=2811421 RepID=A0A974ZRS6_9NOCA|nr:class I SAM-dependent methyltransferase [Rhodococcus pseudokoreensis]QSE88046.1 class I SAM-dependent methyltransferase [Rhodococcus pseudokoreensis]
MSAEVTQAEKDGAKKYSPIVLSAYDTFVLQWSNTYAWRCPRERLLAHYDTHLGARHLDIGPGTGWYLHNATYPTAAPEITLMDLNTNTMAMTTGRLADRAITPAVHTGSILAPIDPAVGVFDSVAANFVFHCVPGTWPQKGVAFGHIARVVADDGVFFGSTILGTGVQHNLFGRALCALYNGPIKAFDNTADDEDGLRTALSAAFEDVEITVIGTVAVFAARRPRRTPAS